MDKVKEILSQVKEIIKEISPRNRLYILLFSLFSLLLIIGYWVLIYFMSIEEAKVAEDEAKKLGIKVSSVPKELQDSSVVDTNLIESEDPDSPTPPLSLPSNVKAGGEQLKGEYRDIRDEDIEAHRELISLFSERELYRKSLKHIERVANYLSDDIVFQAQAGEAYIKAGKPKQAIPHLQKALAKNPKDIDLNIQLAQATFALNKPLEAIQQLKNLHDKFPEDKKVALNLAASQAEIEPFNPDATQIFKDLKSKHPNDPMVWYQSARQWMNQGNFATSKRELQKALDLDPLDQRIHARMGMAEFYLRKYPQAERHYKTALSMNPEDYNTWYNLGELKYSLANRTYRSDSLRTYSREALSNFLQTLALEKDHPKAHYRVGLLLNSNKQFKEAIEHFKKALERQPDHVNSLMGIAIAYEAVGHKDLAIESLERAYYLDPFNRVLADKLSQIRG